jgi:radical SAM protein
MGHPGGHPGSIASAELKEAEGIPGYRFDWAPRNVYWEVTVACDLACQHCRASAQPEPLPGELTTAEGRALVEDVATMKSLLVLTGGDPLKRPDLFELVEHARAHHVPVAVTPSTTPTLTREAVARFKQLGVAIVGMSLDGPEAAVHDGFRCVDGTYASAMNLLEWARDEELPVQVNTTVTALTLPHLPRVYEVLKRNSPPVRRWSLFLLVPVGRGVTLGTPTAAQVEELFGWVYDVSQEAPFTVGTVEAPHYRRYWIERQLEAGMTPETLREQAARMSFGMRDGNGVIFVSSTGEVHPAGFLPEPLGNVKEQSLSSLYRTSPALARLRDADAYEGTCGTCRYRWACGGSRARALSMTGTSMGSDPLCTLCVQADTPP